LLVGRLRGGRTGNEGGLVGLISSKGKENRRRGARGSPWRVNLVWEKNRGGLAYPQSGLRVK